MGERERGDPFCVSRIHRKGSGGGRLVGRERGLKPHPGGFGGKRKPV